MKKKLATLTLLLSTALVATSCNKGDKVNYKENESGKSIIFSIKNGDKVEEYTADDLLKDLQDSDTAKAAIYGAVSRQVFTKYAEDSLKDNQAKLSTIKESAKTKVSDFKTEAQTEANAEGTDYDAYLETKLKAAGVSTLDELEQLRYYELLKEEVTKDFVKEDSHYNYFLNKYISAYTPYQVKHVLVAANTSDTKYYDGTMTVENARKLVNVIEGFINGDSFDIVVEKTDDTSSKDNGGIMPFNEAQNYVSEFRFAPYAQEIFNNNLNEEQRYAIAKDLHVVNGDETSTDYSSKDDFVNSPLYEVYKNGIQTINSSEILRLKDDISSTMAGYYTYCDKDGNLIDDATRSKAIMEQNYADMTVTQYNDDGKINPKYFEEYQMERNWIFNNTVNTKQVKFIEVDSAKATDKNSIEFNGKKILATDGNPIFVAIASTGIHFMSMVWNSYNPTSVNMSDEAKNAIAQFACEKEKIDATEGKYFEALKSKYTDAKEFNQKLNESYFTLYDEKVTDLSRYQYTYIGRNGAYTTKAKLTTSSGKMLDAVKNYVTNLDYYLFDSIVYQENKDLYAGNRYTVDLYDNSLNDLLKEYVQDKLVDGDKSFASSVVSSIKSYSLKLQREEEAKQKLPNYQYKAS